MHAKTSRFYKQAPVVHAEIRPLTKTENVRRVDLSDALLSALSELKRKQRERWLAKEKSEIPEWVFCGRDGGL